MSRLVVTYISSKEWTFFYPFDSIVVVSFPERCVIYLIRCLGDERRRDGSRFRVETGADDDGGVGTCSDIGHSLVLDEGDTVSRGPPRCSCPDDPTTTSVHVLPAEHSYRQRCTLINWLIVITVVFI